MKKKHIFLAEDPTEPELVLQVPSYLVSVEYNPKDPNILAGGCYNGQVRENITDVLLLI